MAFTHATVLALTKYIEVYIAHVISITDTHEAMLSYIEVNLYFKTIQRLCKDSDNTICQPLVDMVTYYETPLSEPIALCNSARAEYIKLYSIYCVVQNLQLSLWSHKQS